MRRIFFLLMMVVLPGILSAQIVNGGMESWRQSSAGDSMPVIVDVPEAWFGSDSVVIALGQSFGYIALGTTVEDWHRQIFKENKPAFVHSGSYSAKIISLYQDTFMTPGIISNAVPGVSIIYTPPGISSFQFSGGTPVTVKPTSVSAWVKYFPGKTTTGVPGIDSGLVFIQARSFFNGIDSVVGSAFYPILKSPQWTHITVNINYTDNIHPVDTLLLAFASTTGNSQMDSSTLYIDDVTMTSVPNPSWIDETAVAGVTSGGFVKVYPNPSVGMLYIDAVSNEDLTFELHTISGAVVASNIAVKQGAINISDLPDGMYFYTVQDTKGNIVQRGKVALNR
jgi:hypothetical protein